MIGAVDPLQGPQVEYSLHAFPLGGYTGFPDEESGKFPGDDPDLLCNRGTAARALVTCAGVLANAAFAYSVLVAQVAPFLLIKLKQQ